ncbi:MAG: MBL fold metallo-hydrolase [Anaerolineales bacterium]
MAELIILGTAASVPTEDHENTHFAVVDESGAILVDCVASPKVRLAKAGIALETVNDLILTHFHPDHVTGVPLLLMNMWLTGRRKALRVYGLHHCLKRMEDMMAFYDWENWPDFFPVAFHRLPVQEQVVLIETEEMRILSSPVRHLIPTLGLRMEDRATGSGIAYSCDTEPCPQVVRLAAGCRVLLHEATGEAPGHSSAAQAGQIAEQARVEELLLIHYPPQSDLEALVEEAQAEFSGDAGLAQDFMRINL